MDKYQKENTQANTQSQNIDDGGKPVFSVIDECYFEPVFQHNRVIISLLF